MKPSDIKEGRWYQGEDEHVYYVSFVMPHADVVIISLPTGKEGRDGGHRSLRFFAGWARREVKPRWEKVE